MQNRPKLLTVAEAAQALGVGVRRLYKLHKDLPTGVVVRLGGSLRFNEDRLLEWVFSGGSIAQ